MDCATYIFTATDLLWKKNGREQGAIIICKTQYVLLKLNAHILVSDAILPNIETTWKFSASNPRLECKYRLDKSFVAQIDRHINVSKSF